jgi:hypothetical protein
MIPVRREIDELLDRAEKSIFEIAQNKIRDSFVSMKNIVGHSFAIVERLYERKEMVTGLATGFVDLDERTSGLADDLIVLPPAPLWENRVAGVAAFAVEKEVCCHLQPGNVKRAACASSPRLRIESRCA